MKLNYISIAKIILLIVEIVWGIYWAITDKDYDFQYKWGTILATIGIFLLLYTILTTSLFYTNDLCYLEKIPDTSKYYIYQASEKQDNIQYLKDETLISYKINDMEIKYDAKEKPYIDIKEGRNCINQVVERDIVIHLNKKED